MQPEEKFQLPVESVEKIRADLLDVFPYDGEKQLIQYRTAEFSAVCPFSGLPDLGQVEIEYIPDKSCLELRSLKYYFISYRTVGIYQEHATNRIFNDIRNVLKPGYLKITTKYNTRGGIDSICTIQTGKLPC
jgi:7-cyano-7-deazaguanine reductase